MQVPSLKNRSLRIDTENVGFLYQYEKCTRSWLITKCKKVVDRYDFNDPKIRMKLKTMGFKLKVVK